MNEETIRELIQAELEKVKDIDTSTVTVEQVREIFREEFPALLAQSVTTIEGNLQLLDSRNIIVGTTTGSKIATASTQKLGFYGASPVDRPDALTAQKTTITHTAPGVEDFALQDLVQNTGFGFATANEGNTLLTVIANLQGRLAQVEARLEELGLITSN